MKTQRPPLVAGLPLIGSAFTIFGSNAKDFLVSQYKNYGPVFRIRALHLNYVVIGGPSANKFINGEGREYFESRKYWQGLMNELETDNFLIGLDGEDHLSLRKMFKQSFDRSAVEPQVDTINKLCIEIFRDIEINQEFEVVERMLHLSSQMIGCVMTGKIPNRDELRNFLYYINTITNHFSLYRLPAWMLKFRSRRFRKAKSLTFNFVEGVIDEHLTKTNSLQNFVDTVMMASEKCPHLFTPGDIRFSAMLPFFAGIDTMGQTINYAMYELHRHPEILSRVISEIDDAFSSGVPNFSWLKEMETVGSVIKETLRLHPAAFAIVRTANKDFEFEGYLVKKGEDVVVFTTASHFMDEYFKEPEKFDIDRFKAPRNEHRQPDIYAPFGRGPHYCLGAGMADALMTLSLGSILYHHKFELPDPDIKIKESINPTPSLGKQFKLRLLERHL